MKEKNKCKICGKEKSKYSQCPCTRGYINPEKYLDNDLKEIPPPTFQEYCSGTH